MSRQQLSQISLIAITWPIFAENVLRYLLTNVDTIMLSHYSSGAVAAVGAVSQVLAMMFLLYLVIASGSAILVAQYLGAGDEPKAQKAASQALLLNLFFGLFVSAGVSFFRTDIIRLMGLPEELHRDAGNFLMIMAASSFVQAVLATCSAMLRSYGNSKLPMKAMVLMNIFNVTGNALVLYGGFSWIKDGVIGVAISTALSQTVVAVAILVITSRNLGIEINPVTLIKKVDWEMVRGIYRIGIPSAGENFTYQASQFAITCIIALLGTSALTTRVITFNLMCLIMIAAFSVSQGAQIVIGHLVGAGRFDEAYRTCIRSVKVGLYFSVSLAIVFYVGRSYILRIYTSDPEIIAMSGKLLFIAILIEPGRVLNMVIIGALKASGDAIFPALMGIFSMGLIAVGLSYFIGVKLGYGLIGVWLAYAADEWLRGIAMSLRWRSHAWEKKALVRKQEPQQFEAAAAEC